MQRSSIFITALLLMFASWLYPLLRGKYSDILYPRINSEDIFNELLTIDNFSKDTPSPSKYRKSLLPPCPIKPPNLKGMVSPPEDLPNQSGMWSEEEMKNLAHEWGVEEGGFFTPSKCQARYTVSIIVFIRDREHQLKTFLQHMHPFLARQQLRYRIVVVDQNNTQSFNRAKLINIGFMEAQRAAQNEVEAQCVIFHDVDLLPLNDLNMYTCSPSPRHMSVAIDTLRFELMYRYLCGGAFAITASHFKLVNGFSNLFFGWGGEDDDFCSRIHAKGLEVTRFSAGVSVYTALEHPPAIKAPDRFQVMDEVQHKSDEDGLSSLHYVVHSRLQAPLMTRVAVSW